MQFSTEELARRVSLADFKNLTEIFHGMLAAGYTPESAAAMLYRLGWESHYFHAKRARKKAMSRKPKNSPPEAIKEGSTTNE